MPAPDNDMLTVILAGGKGSRLLPYTGDLPKPLVPVGGQPVIGYLLAQLRRSGVRRAILAVNHMADQIEAALGDGAAFGLELSYSREPQPLSTVGPLTLIDDLPEQFLVVNGDVISDIDFSRVYEYHRGNDAELTVATHKRVHNVDYGVLTSDESGLVTGFVEKPTWDFEVSMGIYVFSRSLLELVPRGQPYGFDDLMRDLPAAQRKVHAYPYDGYWLDIGRIQDYHRAQDDLPKIRRLLDV